MADWIPPLVAFGAGQCYGGRPPSEGSPTLARPSERERAERANGPSGRERAVMSPAPVLLVHGWGSSFERTWVATGCQRAARGRRADGDRRRPARPRRRAQATRPGGLRRPHHTARRRPARRGRGRRRRLLAGRQHAAGAGDRAAGAIRPDRRWPASGDSVVRAGRGGDRPPILAAVRGEAPDSDVARRLFRALRRAAGQRPGGAGRGARSAGPPRSRRRSWPAVTCPVLVVLGDRDFAGPGRPPGRRRSPTPGSSSLATSTTSPRRSRSPSSTPCSGSSTPSRGERAERANGPSGRERRSVTAPDVAADVRPPSRRCGRRARSPPRPSTGWGPTPSNPDAVRAVYRVKGRPADHPLIVHVASAAAVPRWAAAVPPAAAALAEACWPGPLTLLAPAPGRRRPTSSPAAATRSACGCPPTRSPSAARGVRRRHRRTVGQPLRPGQPDDGRPRAGRPRRRRRPDPRRRPVHDRRGVDHRRLSRSTPPALLRPGGIPLEALEAIVGGTVHTEDGGASRAPGMLTSHYAPLARGRAGGGRVGRSPAGRAAPDARRAGRPAGSRT